MVRRIAGYSRRRPPGRRQDSFVKKAAAWVRRWGKLLIATIVTLGAAAGAITAIKALAPAPDAEDSANLSSIRVVSPISLPEYAQRVQVNPPSRFAGRLSQSTDSSGTPTATMATTSTTPAVTTAGTTGPQPTTVPTSPSPSSSRKSGVGLGHLPQRTLSSVSAVNAQTVDIMRNWCSGPDVAACQQVSIGVTAGNLHDRDGSPIPPDVAAARLLKVLRDARQTAENQPVGAVVAVDVELAGLRGTPVSLTWSLWQAGSKSQLHGDWLNNNLAYVLMPTTDHDTATFDLWIPLPSAPGPYLVRAELGTGQARLASADSEPFD